MSSSTFIGTTEQCLDNLKKMLESGEIPESHVFPKFPRVSPRTLKYWLKGDFSPRGPNLACLRFGMAELGFSVKEVQDLSEDIQTIGRAYSMSTVELEEITQKTGANRRRIINYLVGRYGPADDVADQVSAFAEELRLRDNEDFKESNEEDHKDIIRSFTRCVSEMKSLAEKIISNDFTIEERRKMREDIGRNEFFELCLLMNGLTSEDSRKSFLRELI